MCCCIGRVCMLCTCLAMIIIIIICLFGFGVFQNQLDKFKDELSICLDCGGGRPFLPYAPPPSKIR
ncbi:hypothetical protein Ahy_A07g031099 [Arachis hypogaea]|uniref:Transmembrane protein n=1 Tax=Arachis hypogaea TaxID=3818 RepID=A0A445C2V0_ARAHY|nr:hypothetical protein Ahy_A07g031099 [Arachis hypogaea]